MKTLDLIQSRKHVAHVDDERGDGGCILITLAAGWDFTDDPGCGVKGFETLKEAEYGTRKGDVQPSRIAA